VSSEVNGEVREDVGAELWLIIKHEDGQLVGDGPRALLTEGGVVTRRMCEPSGSLSA